MTLSPSHSLALRLQILSDLERGEREIEIDERFVKPIFSSTQDLLNWCSRWNITPEFFTRKGMKRLNSPINWVSFRKTEPESPVIFIPTTDEEL